MRPGQYAASDGSFGRSAGAAGLRGMLLLAVAVLIGVVLLNATDSEPPGTDVRAAGPGADDAAGGDDDEDEGGETPSTVAPSTPTTVAARPPGEVKVLVANASGVDRAASKTSDELKKRSYNVLSPTNSTQKVDATVVYAAGGYERDAQAVAEALGVPAANAKPMPATLPIDDLRTANVLVLVGPELANRLGGAPAGGSTTTTAAPAAGVSTTTTAAPAATTTTKR